MGYTYLRRMDFPRKGADLVLLFYSIIFYSITVQCLHTRETIITRAQVQSKRLDQTTIGGIVSTLFTKMWGYYELMANAPTNKIG